MTRGDRPRAILAALRDVGPMTRAELCDLLGLAAGAAATALGGMRKPTIRPAGPKRVYIQSWAFEHAGALRYPRPVYAAGRNRCAPAPDRHALRTAAVRRYRAGRRVEVPAAAVNSIFNMGGSL